MSKQLPVSQSRVIDQCVRATELLNRRLSYRHLLITMGSTRNTRQKSMNGIETNARRISDKEKVAQTLQRRNLFNFDI